MNDDEKTKEQLIAELDAAQRSIANLDERLAAALCSTTSTEWDLRLRKLEEKESRYRKLFDESLKREELYASLLNSSADAIVIYDMEGKAQYVSPSFTRIFGWTLEEVYGRRIDFVPESELDRSMVAIRSIIEHGTQSSGFETKRYTKDGRILDISISASRYHDLDGNPGGMLSILRDITDRKQAEEALRQSEEKYRVLYAESEIRRARYRTLLDVSPDPIIVYDMQGIPTFTNPAFTRVFGWTFDKLAGKRTDFVPRENWPETQIMIDKVIKGERFSGQETRRYTKDGRVIDVSISGAPFFGDDGKPTGSVVHLRDITSRKVAQATMAADLKKFQALYDLALALTAENSLDENLTLIVEKSRVLLSADKAFLALRDEEADVLLMHTLSGIVTDEFKALRIPVGVGLGGRVAQTGQLYVVEDYLKEIGPVFQDAATAEGLVSGIAVPVKIGQTNVGVLYVFNRKKTPFSKADLDTLSLLGNLAAVEITRQRSQEKLRESEENFRKLYEEAKRREELYVSLLNSSADAVVIYDMEGRAQYVSPSFTKIFGWTMEEVAGRRIPYLPEEEAEETMAIIMNLIRDGTPCSGFETRRFTKDGRIVDISISSSRYRDHEGNPAGILATLRDISDRKRGEIALRESEERFRTLAEVAPFGIVVMGPDDRTQYVNPTFSELFGYTIEDVPDAPAWFDQAYPTEKSRIKAEAIWREEKEELRRRYGFGAGASPRIFKIRCKDGSPRIVSFRAVALADGRTIATFLDVTAEVDAQQEVIRAKNEWERTFNSVSDLIMILNGNQEIVRVNRAMAERLGLAAEQLIGMRCSDLASSEKVPAAICSDSAALADGKEHSAEVFDEKLGGVFDLRISPLRGDNDNLSGSVHVARDISAFKSLERARRLAVHHLSHELRTPVAVIKGSVKDLADENLTQSAKKRKLERIGRSLTRLSEIQRIVQEIVSPRPYQPTRFPVVQLLNDLLKRIRSESSHRSVTVQARAEPVETDIIDPRLFADVVRTLVKNAIENTPDQGTVVVELRGAPEGILLQVRDQGVGIDWTDREFVFDAFHHTQDTEKYATRNPFDFDAGGKGLELMRLKMLSQEGTFDISFESQRCRHLSGPQNRCPGSIERCPRITGPDECFQSGGTVFSVLFKRTHG